MAEKVWMTAQASEAIARPEAVAKSGRLIGGPIILFFIIAIFASLSLSLARLLGARYRLAEWISLRFGDLPFLEPVLAPLLLLAVEMLFYAIPVLFGWYLAGRVAASFLSVLYDLPDAEAARFLLSRLAKGTATRPVVAVRPEQFVADHAREPLLRVGGPGTIVVSSGSVVVTERNGRFRRILDAGHHQLERYENVHSLLDLRPQERKGRPYVPQPAEPLALFTRDGILLYANLTVIYHICPGDESCSPGEVNTTAPDVATLPLPTRQRPFPFGPGAARRAAYGRTVWGRIDEKGGLREWTWADLAPVIVIESLQKEVFTHSLEELGIGLRPDRGEQDETSVALHALQERVEASAQLRLQHYGVQLISARIDSLELPETITEQLISRFTLHTAHRAQH